MDNVGAIAERIRRGEFLQARRLAESVLALESASLPEKAAAAQLGAEAAYQLKDDQAAIGLARRGVELAAEVGDANTEGRALFRLAGALAAVGDYSLALETAEQFVLGLGDRWPHLEGELGAKAYGNIGLIQRSRRRFPEALQAYWQALTRFQAGGQAEGEAYIRIQMAWLLIMMGDLADAEAHLEQSAALITIDLPGYLAVHQLTHEALLRLGQGKYSKALELAQEVLVSGRSDVSEANRAVALYVSGMCSLRVGEVTTAHIFLSMAREAALQSSLAAVINLVQQLAQEIHMAESAG